jgi:hypothetical protein
MISLATADSLTAGMEHKGFKSFTDRSAISKKAFDWLSFDEQTSRNNQLKNSLKSLATFSRVVKALVERKSETIATSNSTTHTNNLIHVPFRDSSLTRLLRPALDGNCFLSMVTIPPTNLDSASRALRFASQIGKLFNMIWINEYFERVKPTSLPVVMVAGIPSNSLGFGGIQCEVATLPRNQLLSDLDESGVSILASSVNSSDLFSASTSVLQGEFSFLSDELSELESLRDETIKTLALHIRPIKQYSSLAFINHFAVESAIVSREEIDGSTANQTIEQLPRRLEAVNDLNYLKVQKHGDGLIGNEEGDRHEMTKNEDQYSNKPTARLALLSPLVNSTSQRINNVATRTKLMSLDDNGQLPKSRSKTTSSSAQQLKSVAKTRFSDPLGSQNSSILPDTGLLSKASNRPGKITPLQPLTPVRSSPTSTNTPLSKEDKSKPIERLTSSARYSSLSPSSTIKVLSVKSDKHKNASFHQLSDGSSKHEIPSPSSLNGSNFLQQDKFINRNDDNFSENMSGTLEQDNDKDHVSLSPSIKPLSLTSAEKVKLLSPLSDVKFALDDTQINGSPLLVALHQDMSSNVMVEPQSGHQARTKACEEVEPDSQVTDSNLPLTPILRSNRQSQISTKFRSFDGDDDLLKGQRVESFSLQPILPPITVECGHSSTINSETQLSMKKKIFVERVEDFKETNDDDDDLTPEERQFLRYVATGNEAGALKCIEEGVNIHVKNTFERFELSACAYLSARCWALLTCCLLFFMQGCHANCCS